MHQGMVGTGAALMAGSFFLALVLVSVDPLWAETHLNALAAAQWLRDAALVLGAVLVAAGLVVARLAPPVPQRDPRSEPVPDWFS